MLFWIDVSVTVIVMEIIRILVWFGMADEAVAAETPKMMMTTDPMTISEATVRDSFRGLCTFYWNNDFNKFFYSQK